MPVSNHFGARLYAKTMSVKAIRFLTRKICPMPWGFAFAFTAIGLAANISALRLAFNLGYFYQLFDCTGPLPITCYLSMAGSYAMVITFSLALSAIGLWSGRLVGFLFSLISVIWIGEIYREWYTATLYNMKIFGAREFFELQSQQQYLLPLDQATWWDIVVLGLALIIFIWQVGTLKRLLRPVAAISEKKPPSVNQGEFRTAFSRESNWL